MMTILPSLKNYCVFVLFIFVSTTSTKTTHGFFITSSPSLSSPSPLLSSLKSSSSSSLTKKENTNDLDIDDTNNNDHDENKLYSVQVMDGGEDDPRVIDVATFRNGLMNPQMIVTRAQKKRDGIDTTQAALNGLKIGLVYIGPIIAVGTYFTTPSDDDAITKALTNYGLFGGSLGAILAVNNYMGRSVHVPDIPEATNRIVVDLSEGLLRNQDLGFIAISNSSDDNDGNHKLFLPSNGVMATVDGQLRNSVKSPPGVRTVTDYPSHIHIKNMEVHNTKRRQGIGNALLKLIIDYAQTETDAQLLTLEVEAVNQPAVQLYRKFGFETKENPNRRSKNVFMIKNLY